MRSQGTIAPESARGIVEGLFAWLSLRLPGTISAFLPMEGEVDLGPLMRRLPGWRWVLPRVEPDRSLTFRDAATPTETHPFGMEQPMGSGPIIPIQEIDVFLVPGLAFDLQGRRLGNGAGHYDRVLSQSRADAEHIGIAPEAHRVDLVPTEAHDVRVDWLATENGVVRCHPSE